MPGPVAVALSGGADSLYALALLARAGVDAFGLHAHFLPPDDAARSLAGEIEARCRTLGVRFHAIDLSGEFERRVIAPFVAAYRDGLTPNPCARCNAAMKFGLLLSEAGRLGAAALATGHYARLEAAGPGRARLFRGADASRDQSYFLAMVPGERLAKAVFPLHATLKKTIPAELAALGVPAPLGQESREICFIPGDDYRAFLTSRGGLPGPGRAVFADGRTAGRHQGLWRHTIGQRKGLGIAHSEPLYVLAKDAGENRLVVGAKAELMRTEFYVEGINFLRPRGEFPDELAVQTCYRGRPLPVAGIEWEGENAVRVTLAAPAARPAPGQAAVFYALDEVVAGGWIADGEV